MGEDFAQMLFLTSPLHDIGKIGIPDYILLKPAQLDQSEWDIMMRHSVIGARILQQDPMLMTAFHQSRSSDLPDGLEQNDNPILQMASSIALTHHEKWDGSGYPEGLAGAAIPLESRIVALADVYDALRSDRPYHAGYPENEALEVMRRGVGTHFDPEVHAAFEKMVAEIEAIRSQFSDSDMASARQAQQDTSSLRTSTPSA